MAVPDRFAGYGLHTVVQAHGSRRWIPEDDAQKPAFPVVGESLGPEHGRAAAAESKHLNDLAAEFIADAVPAEENVWSAVIPDGNRMLLNDIGYSKL